MRFRLSSLMILTAVAAVYAAVIALVNRHALWDGIDVYRGRATWFTIGTLLFAALKSIELITCLQRGGEALVRFTPPGACWAHLPPTAIALILAVGSYASNMRFPALFCVTLAVVHVAAELAAEVTITDRGVFRGGLFSFDKHFFYVKRDSHDAWLMRRDAGKKPRKRFCRLPPECIDHIVAMLTELQFERDSHQTPDPWTDPAIG